MRIRAGSIKGSGREDDLDGFLFAGMGLYTRLTGNRFNHIVLVRPIRAAEFVLPMASVVANKSNPGAPHPALAAALAAIHTFNMPGIFIADFIDRQAHEHRTAFAIGRLVIFLQQIDANLLKMVSSNFKGVVCPISIVDLIAPTRTTCLPMMSLATTEILANPQLCAHIAFDLSFSSSDTQDTIVHQLPSEPTVDYEYAGVLPFRCEPCPTSSATEVFLLLKIVDGHLDLLGEWRQGQKAQPMETAMGALTRHGAFHLQHYSSDQEWVWLSSRQTVLEFAMTRVSPFAPRFYCKSLTGARAAWVSMASVRAAASLSRFVPASQQAPITLLDSNQQRRSNGMTLSARLIDMFRDDSPLDGKLLCCRRPIPHAAAKPASDHKREKLIAWTAAAALGIVAHAPSILMHMASGQ